MRNRLPSPSVHVYKIGVGFKRTAETLLNQSPKDFDWVCPFIANASLSIEIFLKSCLAEDEYSEFQFQLDDEDTTTCFQYLKSDVKDESKTHNLTDLFGKLSDKRKARIKGEYQKTDMYSKYPKIGSILNELNGLFEAARYGYSNPDLFPQNLSIIIDIAQFFEDVIPKLEGVE
ncbi:hypothetical protein [Shewanella xiamenensis]|uniref:hypothetical protein n=1 Tax=Shewanella xiamenensis TaxID=332186 RepID=UPI0024A6C5DC|nr:hypothetical protein [Shewanella xiamenensis]MDI5874830.1 hypothetical protein [Shewanella xiamenensis]